MNDRRRGAIDDAFAAPSRPGWVERFIGALRRVASGGPGIGVDRHEINVIFAARHAVIISFQLMSYVGRARGVPWWEPIVDLGLVVPYSLIGHAASLRRGHMPGWIPIVDSLILAAWVVGQPSTTPQLVAMMVATLTIAGQSVGRRWLWGAFVISVAVMTLSAAIRGDQPLLMDSLRFAFLGAGVLATVTAVRSARIRAQEEQRRQAQHDRLTGLANRMLLHERVESMPRGDAFAVLLLDLNNFKEVNDALGHHVGDELLIAVSQRLVASVPAGSTVGRLGGDEFAVLVPSSWRRDAIDAADRITGALLPPFVVDGLTIEAGASIGIALHDGPGPIDSEMLVRQADVAMYQAKQAGRPFRVYDPNDDRSSVRRLTLLGELRTAIAEDQLEVWYQPGMDVKTGERSFMEALVRWRHPRHGLLMPDEFIELAEISGAIDDLTRWVIERSIRDTQRLGEMGRNVLVSCNLSVRNLHDRELLQWLERHIAECGLPPRGLYLELTESQIMEDPIAASNVLKQFAEMGIGSAIDDFGTGYSSLAMLLHVRATVLKIDRSFVADLLVTHEAQVMVRSMIELGHNLGMLVVAEGVEDEPTLMALGELGCDFIQGYHAARPMPFEDLVPFLGANVAECTTG